MKSRFAGLLVAFLFTQALAWADVCDVCGEPLGEQFYFCTDKVEQTKKCVCLRCGDLTTVCYLCGMPAFRDFTELADGRVICKRDLPTVVLDEAEARQLCDDVMDAVERQFSRFTAFPRTNAFVELMDRVRLHEMFKIAGRDYVCPNIWGCTTRQTNGTHTGSHQISLLTGLPRPQLKATCVHEFGHVWIHETVPAARLKRLHRDAQEGFCELVSYLVMVALQELDTAQEIKLNFYTRGQIHCFIEAEARFGFNEIVEWMLQGEDDRLHPDNLGRVRRLSPAQTRRQPEPTLPLVIPPPQAPAPEALTLKSVLWSPTRPLAMINGRVFAPQEQGAVPLGGTNVNLRCLVIRKSSVRVRLVETGEETELELPAN